MNRNVKIARELVRLAKSLVADENNPLGTAIKEALKESISFFEKAYTKSDVMDSFKPIDVVLVSDQDPQKFWCSTELVWDTPLLSNALRAERFHDTIADFCSENRSLLGRGDEEFDDEVCMFKDLTDEKLRALTQKIFSTKEIKEAFRRQMSDSVYTFNVLLTLEVTLKAVPNGNYEVEYCAIIGGPHKRKTKMTKLSRLFSKGEGDILKNILIDNFKKINSRSF